MFRFWVHICPSNLKWFCVSSCTRQLFPKQFCSTKLKSDTKEKGDKIYDNILVNQFWITDIIIFLDTKIQIWTSTKFFMFLRQLWYTIGKAIYILYYFQKNTCGFFDEVFGDKKKGEYAENKIFSASKGIEKRRQE